MFWPAVLPPLVLGAALSLLAERLVRPGVLPFRRRAPAALAIHLGLWLVLFAFELAVFRRPWFAAAIVLFFLLVIVLVGNAKFQSLREPFIFQDFEYFIDTLKHPRLYLPFFGLVKTVLATAAFASAVFAGMTFEPSLTAQMAAGDFFAGTAVLAVAGTVLILFGARRKLPVSFEPATDLRQLGLVAGLWRYGEEEHRPRRLAFPYDGVRPADRPPQPLAPLVVVQSESFFDVRRLYPPIRPEILREFDLLKSGARHQGKLTVPAWGANTVRTEFAFLSGLAGEVLGVHRFNPYRKLARRGVPTLAGFLRGLGYRTLCVHPYPAAFYRRNQVLPLLGFDEFIDIRGFAGVEKTGPYIGDVALADKVCALLAASSARPIFIFVITMENHGPLHLEKVRPGEAEHHYLTPPPAGCDDLTIYLRHLRNADRMAGMLRDRLEALPGAGRLCWFGDHVPIMPTVYRALGVPDGQTDYFIWEKGGNPGNRAARAMDVEQLGLLLLEDMGLIDPTVAGLPGRPPLQGVS